MQSKIIFDPLYGFIHLTQAEWEIIHTLFYQRLRWIKQIGFSFFTFPGAEHSRFGHSIGVMFNAHKIIESIDRGVRDEELFDSSFFSSRKEFHQSVRLAALMHDLGTFCFSHTTEMAYIEYAQTSSQKNSKGHPDDHEHLGSWIIKNTDFEGGITYVLKKYKISPQLISDLVKGVSENKLANMILHSEIDCDRMDYLLRDAHYTGLRYGTYDRDYLLHHFEAKNVGGTEVLAIKHNALYCVEDFLSARFSWYSQVVRSARGAKFDALAKEMTSFLLEKGQIYSYAELLDMVKNNPVKFYSFNDNYFMQLLHRLYTEGVFEKNKRMKDIAHALLFGKSPETIRTVEFNQRILNQDENAKNEKIIKKALEKAHEIESFLRKNGSSEDWLVADIPKKPIVFVNSKKKIIKKKSSSNLLHERDPAKIITENGDVQLLVDLDNSVISMLQNTFNFIPNVFCSSSALELLKKKGMVE